LEAAAVGDVAENGLSIEAGLGIERRIIWVRHWKDRDATR